MNEQQGTERPHTDIGKHTGALIDENPFERLTKERTINLIKQLTGQGNVLVTPILFVKALGSADAALLLGQILYWSDKAAREDGFIWKTRKEWTNEIGLSGNKLRQATEILKKASCGLETKVLRANGSPTVHYHLDRDKFFFWIEKESRLQMDLCYSTNGNVPGDKSLTEDTSEDTSENNSIKTFLKEKSAIPSEIASPKHVKVKVVQKKVKQPVEV